jgi:TetR/AcrR family transcriptional repressor of nem operon
MRVTREKAAENRARIVEAAARLFREQGFDGVGVDAIMSAAGLTHGGFYGHFASKDDLATEAVAAALQRSATHQARLTNLRDFVADYLSDRHVTDRGNGCALAALGADMGRKQNGIRRAASDYLRTQIEHVAGLFGFGSRAKRRKHAIATLAGMVGALTLARAVDDPALAKEILAAGRDAFSKAAQS